MNIEDFPFGPEHTFLNGCFFAAGIIIITFGGYFLGQVY